MSLLVMPCACPDPRGCGRAAPYPTPTAFPAQRLIDWTFLHAAAVVLPPDCDDVSSAAAAVHRLGLCARARFVRPHRGLSARDKHRAVLGAAVDGAPPDAPCLVAFADASGAPRLRLGLSPAEVGDVAAAVRALPPCWGVLGLDRPTRGALFAPRDAKARVWRALAGTSTADVGNAFLVHPAAIRSSRFDAARAYVSASPWTAGGGDGCELSARLWALPAALAAVALLLALSGLVRRKRAVSVAQPLAPPGVAVQTLFGCGR